MNAFALVALGGAIGAALRHAVGLATLRAFGPGFPYGTLAVNVIGSAAMGLLIAFLARGAEDGTSLRLFVATGLLGGFTTFSTFSLDVVAMWERGEAGGAFLYIAASLALGIGGLIAGLAIGRAVL